MEEPTRATVTSLSSLFPAEEAQKASKRVQETIAERQKELDQLQEFMSDNTSLIKLVQKLPDELHHDIMVPFGKAAFFPGRLIHSNEFLVLLGEGYYSERTSKQTTDILKRRGTALGSQHESLKAVIQDLKAEASFFEVTAAEAAEGLVEIMEEYSGETFADKVPNAGLEKPGPHPNYPESDGMKPIAEDEEFARIMARMDEYQKEELAEESDECDEDDEHGHPVMTSFDELQKKELADESLSEYDEDEHTKADFGHYRSHHSPDHKHKSLKGHQLVKSPEQSKDDHPITKELPRKVTFQQDLSNQLQHLEAQPVSEDKSPSSSALTKLSSAETALVHANNRKENVLVEPQSTNKAFFPGSIVEHPHNLEGIPRERATASSKSTTPQTSKPVSRFKLQRR